MTRKRKSRADPSSAALPKRPARDSALRQQICTTWLLQPPVKIWQELPGRHGRIRPFPPRDSGTAEGDSISPEVLQTNPPRTTLPAQNAHPISGQPVIGLQLPECSHRALASPSKSLVAARVPRTHHRADRRADQQKISAKSSSLPFPVRVPPAPLQGITYDARSAVDRFLSLHNGSDQESDDSSDSSDDDDDASVINPRSDFRGSFPESFASQIPLDSRTASEGVDTAPTPVLPQAGPSAEPPPSDVDSDSQQIQTGPGSRASKSLSSPATLALRVAEGSSPPRSTSLLRRSPSSCLAPASEGSSKDGSGPDQVLSTEAKAGSRDRQSALTKTVQFRDKLSGREHVHVSLRPPSSTATSKVNGSALANVSERSPRNADSVQELYDEMNEIVGEVLGVTRALPTSKLFKILSCHWL
jgi:hypothetical protein